MPLAIAVAAAGLMKLAVAALRSGRAAAPATEDMAEGVALDEGFAE